MLYNRKTPFILFYHVRVFTQSQQNVGTTALLGLHRIFDTNNTSSSAVEALSLTRPPAIGDDNDAGNTKKKRSRSRVTNRDEDEDAIHSKDII